MSSLLPNHLRVAHLIAGTCSRGVGHKVGGSGNSVLSDHVRSVLFFACFVFTGGFRIAITEVPVNFQDDIRTVDIRTVDFLFV